jgi:hypothetical protein
VKGEVEQKVVELLKNRKRGFATVPPKFLFRVECGGS